MNTVILNSKSWIAGSELYGTLFWERRERLHCVNEPACTWKMACFDYLQKNGRKERTEINICTALFCNPHNVFPQVGAIIDMHIGTLATAKYSMLPAPMGVWFPHWGWASLRLHLELCSTNTASCSRHHFRDTKVIYSLYCVKNIRAIKFCPNLLQFCLYMGSGVNRILEKIDLKVSFWNAKLKKNL